MKPGFFFRIYFDKIGASHIGKRIIIRGRAKKISPIVMQCKNALFQCERCGMQQYVEQSGQSLKSPSICKMELGGCGSKKGVTRFNLLKDGSRYHDFQRFILKNHEKNSIVGITRNEIEINCNDKLVGLIRSRDIVDIAGILHYRSRNMKRPSKGTYFIEAIDIELIDRKSKK